MIISAPFHCDESLKPIIFLEEKLFMGMVTEKSGLQSFISTVNCRKTFTQGEYKVKLP